MKKQKVVNVEIKRKTFRQRFMEGKITDFQEALLDEVDLWHEGTFSEPLHEFLGLNPLEYDLCLKCSEEFENYLKALRGL